MKFRFLYGSSVLTLPAGLLDKLDAASEGELRVLLKLSAAPGEFEPSSLASELGMEESELQNALSFWRGAGILKTDGSASQPKKRSESAERIADKSAAEVGAPQDAQDAQDVQDARENTQMRVQVNTRTGKDGRKVTVVQTDDVPHYNAEEIRRIFAENTQLSGMFDECQNILGKLFNSGETNKLLALIDYFGLEPEYVVLLCYHSKKVGRASVSYVDKLAKSLWQEGIVTTEALEEKLEQFSVAADLGSVFRQLAGTGKQSFTDNQQKYISQWAKWQISPELLKLAYEVAVDNTGKPSMPYINKVLTNWRDAGYKTPEDALAAMEAYKQKKSAQGSENSFSSFDTDEFFEAALNKSFEMHKKLLESKGKSIDGQ